MNTAVVPQTSKSQKEPTAITPEPPQGIARLPVPDSPMMIEEVKDPDTGNTTKTNRKRNHQQPAMTQNQPQNHQPNLEKRKQQHQPQQQRKGLQNPLNTRKYDTEA
jgi:hypothetical protein